MQNFIYVDISFCDLALSEYMRITAISVGIFGYKIKYTLQMAKCINTEFET